jgi:hypothetical protein
MNKAARDNEGMVEKTFPAGRPVGDTMDHGGRDLASRAENCNGRNDNSYRYGGVVNAPNLGAGNFV